MGGNPTRKTFWELVLTKVAKRLDGWKRAFLSRGGRLTLIRSVLSSLPIYYLSIQDASRSNGQHRETNERFSLRWVCVWGGGR